MQEKSSKLFDFILKYKDVYDAQTLKSILLASKRSKKRWNYRKYDIL